MNEINKEPRLSPGTEVIFRYNGRGKNDVGRKHGLRSSYHFKMAIGIVQEINERGHVIIKHDGGIYNRNLNDVCLSSKIKEQLLQDPSFIVKGLHDIQEVCA